MIAFDDIAAAGDWLRQTLSGFGIRGLWLDALLTVIAVAVVANFAFANAGLMSWAWRREMAFIQDRQGPNRVGPQGILQVVADGIKLILKQVMIPRNGDKVPFLLAPVFAVFPFLMAYLVIPFSRGGALADLNVGVLYLFAIASLTLPAVFLAGWSSNNKYSMLGGMRGIAQLLAFEVPLTMSVLGVVLLTGSLSLQTVVASQHRLWFIFPQALGALVFLVAGMAENAVHPFDLPEAESELVSGYMTEYSGIMGFLFLAAELGTTWTLGALFATFFLGGWMAPIPFFDVPIFWFLAKCYLMFFLLTIVRFSMARFRIDQFLSFGWKVLIPLSFVNLAISAVEVLVTKGFFQP